MAKHGVKFDKAFVFDADALRRLPVVRIKPTLEYDAKAHSLAGPLLASVAGRRVWRPATRCWPCARWTATSCRCAWPTRAAYRMIVATEIDGAPLALGGLGPQWAVYEADTLAAFKDKPLKERFALCPWGLYCIEVTRAESARFSPAVRPHAPSTGRTRRRRPGRPNSAASSGCPAGAACEPSVRSAPATGERTPRRPPR